MAKPSRTNCQAVHGIRRRSLAPLDHFKLPLLRTYKHFLTQKYAAKSTFDIDSAVNDDNRSSNNNSFVALHLQSSPAPTTTSTIAVTQQHLTLASLTAQQ
ncbi:hypothetical protein TYRP_013935 [Tyrophagus putrescentiae]|nr:hypothetical protein TYRP_023016 [Tyrophagus putrescentiae]KAH9406324.1 hypothetical protein TYRP_013935 [Tyrophagus putrescentiae]